MAGPYEEHSQIAAWQQRLAQDLGAARRYGENHPDEYGAVAYENDGVKISFTGHLNLHRAALAERVAHPDRLQVVLAASTAEDRRAARTEIGAALGRTPRGAMASVAETFEGIEARLGAGCSSLAAELHARFGPAVMLWVGHKAFPFGAEMWAPASLPESTVTWPDLLAVTVPEVGSVPSGDTVRAEVRFLNRGVNAVRFTTGIVAGGLARVGGDTWAARFAGLRTLEAYRVDLPPGGTGRLRALIGTASVEPGDAPAPAPGDYEVIAPVRVRLPESETSLGHPNGTLVVRGGTLELTEPGS